MFFSHPGVPLEQHLLEVGKSAEGFVNRTNLADAALLASIARIMGYCHDFGKYTTFFQEHLPPLKRNSGAKQHHSLLSAILAANEVNHLCEGMTQTDEASRYLPLLAFLAVRRHHGDLCAPNTVIPPAQALADFPKLPHIGSAQREELKALPEQIKNIRQSPDFALVVLQMRKLGVADLKAFLVVNKCLNVLRKLGKLCYQYENDQVPVQTRKRVCSWMLLLYSSLIDADKKSAAQVRQVRRAGIPPEVVGNFLKCMPQDDTPEWMQKLRQSVRRAVMEKVKQIPTSQRLLTLTAPTGSGKTLTALSVALELRERIRKETGATPRVIYALPFVNIIEQNFRVFDEVLSNLPDYGSSRSVYLLKHHHLSGLKYHAGDEDRSLEESLLLTEAWDSEITVTTFVQLFHTLLGFKNRFLKKFHNIPGSIIILDEIQCLPVEYWDLVGEVLRNAAGFLNCTILLMTATRPAILSPDEVVELLPSNEQYFAQLDRVTIEPELTPCSVETFCDSFARHLSGNKSYLVVINTIASSLAVYRGLTERLKGRDGIEFAYLSTNIIPVQRRARLELVRRRLKKKLPVVVVSTQIVEAGVDLDFDEVYRDIGPFDSIVQVAGRCNRSGKRRQRGVVHVFNLEDRGKVKVYGKIHLAAARSLLDKTKIQEKNLQNLTERYFQYVKERHKDICADNVGYWKAAQELCFHDRGLAGTGRCVSDFHLIDDVADCAEVFVEVNQTAVRVRQDFKRRVLKETDPHKRRVAYLELKRPIGKYLLSVRRQRIANNKPPPMESCDMYFVPLKQLKYYYDRDTGFRFENKAGMFL